MPTVHTRGARVSYSRTGTGPPVLLIQGVGAIGNAWRPQIDGLRDRFSLIAFDNRGIGASATDDAFLTVEGMADDALAILDAEGIDRCHVAGHSMGGLIAMQLALTSPRRVKSLALLCTFPNGRLGARLTRDTFMAPSTGAGSPRRFPGRPTSSSTTPATRSPSNRQRWSIGCSPST